MSDALQRKLRRLGVVKGAEGLPKPPDKPQVHEIAQPATSLPGREIITDHGSFWLDKRVYDAQFVHGPANLAEATSVSEESLSFFGIPSLGSAPAFIDTETTGLAGGSGTIAFLIGIGIWAGDAFTIHLIFIRNPDEEKAALHYTAEILENCTGLVTFNGRTFDMPLLQTRFILNRLSPNWHDLPHLDLLAVSRNLWRDHLPSRSLGNIEQSILGIMRTDEDLPSYLIPYYYRQYLETGDTTQMRQVMYHNEIDILSLVSLLAHAAHMVAQPEDMDLAPTEWAGVGNVFYGSGLKQKALDAWEKALSQDAGVLPDTCTSRLCGRIGVYYKRSTRWDMALSAWDTWVEKVPDAVKPLVEKAKYYEWTANDVEKALDVTETAIARAEQHYDGFSRDKLIDELLHRKQRLTRKLAGEATDELEETDDE